MNFTDEEKTWLEEISSEVPENDELTPGEQCLHDLAKPQSALEEFLFELMASLSLESVHHHVKPGHS
ncbi:hypothetical protein AAFF_G00337490 [Aldrovandia affinis]|uniref:Uncharacterized protein n=1 Tax=Aldrovandia affinis TaxID=143900 RepID=A0AAD7SM10_9TELE|nr:hypothetical protein AAFF_G00337490 [Aldrovandia affinis]